MVGVGVWLNEKWKKKEGRRRQKRECVQVGRGHSTRKARKAKKGKERQEKQEKQEKQNQITMSNLNPELKKKVAYFSGPFFALCARLDPWKCVFIFLRLRHGALAHPHVVQ